MKTLFRRRCLQVGVGALALLNILHAGVMAQGAYRAYYATDPVGRNVVSILSRAPLETMLTTTSTVEADIQINPANVLASPRAKFVIPMDSLDTGIPLRNQHMKSENWLNTAKYPTATFTFKRFLPPVPRRLYTAQAGEKANLQVEGEMDFHGVKKLVTARVFCEALGENEATKARLNGELGHVRATFPLKLDDYGVKIPEMARLKVANVQEVTVDVFVSTGSDKPAWAS